MIVQIELILKTLSQNNEKRCELDTIEPNECKSTLLLTFKHYNTLKHKYVLVVQWRCVAETLYALCMNPRDHTTDG